MIFINQIVIANNIYNSGRIELLLPDLCDMGSPPACGGFLPVTSQLRQFRFHLHPNRNTTDSLVDTVLPVKARVPHSLLWVHNIRAT